MLSVDCVPDRRRARRHLQRCDRSERAHRASAAPPCACTRPRTNSGLPVNDVFDERPFFRHPRRRRPGSSRRKSDSFAMRRLPLARAHARSPPSSSSETRRRTRRAVSPHARVSPRRRDASRYLHLRVRWERPPRIPATVRRHRARGAGRAGDALTRFTGSWTGDVRRELEDGRGAPLTSSAPRPPDTGEGGRAIAYDETSAKSLNYHLKQLGAAVRVTECVRVDRTESDVSTETTPVTGSCNYKLSVGTETMVGVCSILLVVRRRSGLLAGRETARATAGDAAGRIRGGEIAGRQLCGAAGGILVREHGASSFRANGCQAVRRYVR